MHRDQTIGWRSNNLVMAGESTIRRCSVSRVSAVSGTRPETEILEAAVLPRQRHAIPPRKPNPIGAQTHRTRREKTVAPLYVLAVSRWFRGAFYCYTNARP